MHSLRTIYPILGILLIPILGAGCAESASAHTISTPIPVSPEPGAQISSLEQTAFQWEMDGSSLKEVGAFEFQIFDRELNAPVYSAEDISADICKTNNLCEFKIEGTVDLTPGKNHVWRVRALGHGKPASDRVPDRAVPTSEDVSSSETVATSETLPSGAGPATGASNQASASVPGSETVLALDKVPLRVTVPAAGDTVPAGGTVPAASDTVPASSTVPAASSTVPAGGTVPAASDTVPASDPLPASDPNPGEGASEFSNSTFDMPAAATNDVPAQPVDSSAGASGAPVALSSDGAHPASTSALSGTDPNSNAAVPEYLETITNPNGTKLTRITENSAFGVANGKARHEYSKIHVWNADQTLMDVASRVVDAKTYSIGRAIALNSNRSWSNTNPNLMYGMHYDPLPNNFSKFDVTTGEVTLLKQFSEYGECTLGDWEGSITNDDRYVLLACSGGSVGTKTLIAYDIANNNVMATMPAADGFNWASFTPSGKNILVENNAYPNPPRELFRYDIDLTNPFKISDHPEHGDMGVDVDGNDVYVMIASDYLHYVRLSDGVRVNLAISGDGNPMGFGHVSCRNVARPGWCYFTSEQDSRVGAARIGEGAAEVELWGYHRSSIGSYDSQPKGSVSRDGSKIVFTSDWYGRGQINDYVLEFPQS